MSEQARPGPAEPGAANGEGGDRWELQVQSLARSFPYPPAPDIAAAVRSRLDAPARTGARPRWTMRPAWVALLVAVLLAVLFSVPQVRAGIIEVFRLGAVRIFMTTPTPAPPTATPIPTPAPAAGGAAASSATPTPSPAPRPSATPTSTLVPTLLDLQGESTLAGAQARAQFPIELPSYPPDLGAPDRVFVQSMGGPVVILVWLDPNRPDGVRLSLHEYGPGTYAEKVRPATVEETTVNEQRALWTTGEHMLLLKNGDMVVRRLVRGHTLIWVKGNVTYEYTAKLSVTFFSPGRLPLILRNGGPLSAPGGRCPILLRYTRHVSSRDRSRATGGSADRRIGAVARAPAHGRSGDSGSVAGSDANSTKNRLTDYLIRW